MAQRRLVAQHIQDNGMSLEQGHKMQQQLAARQQVCLWLLDWVADMPQRASAASCCSEQPARRGI